MATAHTSPATTRPRPSSPTAIGQDSPAGEWPPAEHDALTDRARQYARESVATTTWRTYETRWSRFQTWCARQGESALPADPLTVCRFLTDLAPWWRPATPDDPAEQIVAGHVLVRPGLRPHTVAGYLTAIAVAHQPDHGAGRLSADPAAVASGHDTTPTATEHAGHVVATTPPATTPAHGPANPAHHPLVRRVLAGIRRHPTVAPARRRAALRPDGVRAILARLDPAGCLTDARDAALLLLGWHAALRADDLARLDITDVTICEDGLTVHLRRSKTDQEATGATLGITPRDPGDPLDAVAAWICWRNRLASHGLHTGPAWRAIDRYDRRPRATRLTTKSINIIVRRHAETAQLKGAFGSHSLRRGFATSALAGGASERAVQHHGRWKSPASMAAYVEEANRFDDTNPTRFLR